MVRVEDRTGQTAAAVAAAALRASSTSSVRMWSAIAHPASRREQQSITVARYRLPPLASGR